MIRSATRLLALAVVATGCAAGELQQASVYRGDSGSVNWEIVGIRTTISDDDQQIRWNYTVILRETAGRTIQFEHMETSARGSDHPDALMAGIQKEPFRLRLAPRAEYRFSTNYGISFTAPSSRRFGDLPGGRGGVTVLYRLMGRDESGLSVTVTIPVPLYPGAGTQVRAPARPAPPVSPTVPPPTSMPEPARAEARVKHGSSPNPARQAADECASRSMTLKVLDIGETGDVNFEHAPGEEEEFLACFTSKVEERLQGRLVDVPGGPLRTAVGIEPQGTSFVVVATIDATHRARLLVDTGATMTIVRPRLIEGIEGAVEVDGLRPRIVVATGDAVNIRLARLRSFALGGFEVEGLHVGVYDVVPQIADIDGLLGTDFLHRFVINVDGGARQLSLERKP